MSAPSTPNSGPAAPPGLVVGGYLSAVLIPIVGLILGVMASRRYEGVGTNHGPWMIAIAALSLALNLLILVSSSG